MVLSETYNITIALHPCYHGHCITKGREGSPGLLPCVYEPAGLRSRTNGRQTTSSVSEIVFPVESANAFRTKEGGESACSFKLRKDYLIANNS